MSVDAHRSVIDAPASRGARAAASRSLYSAFGLTIASEIPLIDLTPGAGPADVEITFGRVPGAFAHADEWVVLAAPNDVRGWAPGVGAFAVRDGREIVVDPVNGADAGALRMTVVGPLLGALLAQRGAFVLHASTVSVNGQAVAFLGPSGRGKSTMAATLTLQGHPFIADDMTVIDMADGRAVVRQGFPRVKLWPDSAEALDGDPERLPLLRPDMAKRSLQLASFSGRDPIPLARCYLLEDGDEESVEELPSLDAVMALVRYTYQSTWVRAIGAEQANLRQCAAVVELGVVRQLRRRRVFEALDEAARMVLDDAALFEFR